MKITKIDLLLCDPVEDGWRPPMCRVYTDEGIYGDGEAALSYGGARKAAYGMLEDRDAIRHMNRRHISATNT